MLISQRFFVVIFYLISLPWAALEATSLRERPLGELSSDAREIYRVKILSTEFRKFKGQVWTEYKAQVLEAYKGDTPSSDIVRLHLPGGKDGVQAVKILGLPNIEINQEYIVFLRDRLSSPGLHRLTDWSAYIVGRDEGGQRYVISATQREDSHNHSRSVRAVSRNKIHNYEAFVEDLYFHMDQ